MTLQERREKIEATLVKAREQADFFVRVAIGCEAQLAMLDVMIKEETVVMSPTDPPAEG